MEEIMIMAVSLILMINMAGPTWADMSFDPADQSENRRLANTQSCPVNLSALHDEIESLLMSVSNQSFKTTIRASLKASIPEAIQRADGINRQLAFLQREIVAQDRFRQDAEEIARKSSGNFSGALKPCRPGEKGSYCSAVERFYISSAANVVNRGFLAALECYKRSRARQ